MFSIRVIAVLLLSLGLAAYAWRDWFKALCGLIVLMAVFNHPDMPREVAGISGLNPWNALMGVIIAAWWVGRHHDGLRWDMDRRTAMLVGLFALMMVVGIIRMMFNREAFHDTAGHLMVEYGLNTFKWLIPAVLLFDGCRTRKQVTWVVLSLSILYALLALQAVKYSPLDAAFGRTALETSRRVIKKNTGYHTCDLGPVLAGAAWALLACMPLFAKRWLKAGCLAAALLATYGMVVCGARAGMMAWVVAGLIFCLLRWRKWLLLAPVVPVVAALALPGFVDRMAAGLGETDVTGQKSIDTYELTSGRAVVWPMVFRAIGRAPLLGYGREGFVISGVRAETRLQCQDEVPHPHNMFLQILLDGGFVAALVAFALFGHVAFHAARMFRARGDPLIVAVGGWTLGLIVALWVGGIGAMTFYPRESLMGVFCAMMLTMRVRQLLAAERARRVRMARPVAAYQPFPVAAPAYAARGTQR